MKKYKNKDGVQEMFFSTSVTTYCPLGKNYTPKKVECEILLGNIIVDFNDIEKYFKNELNGSDNTNEELTRLVFDKIVNEYKPEYAKVTVIGDTHFHVETSIETK